MATFRILEDENVVELPKKRIGKEKNEIISRKRCLNSRPALQCLNNDSTQQEFKRAKLSNTHNVRITVQIQKNQPKEVVIPKEIMLKGTVSESDDESDLNMEQLKLTEQKTGHKLEENGINFPTELLHNDEYRKDVLSYLMELELKYQWPKVNCMERQTHLTSDMRSVLVDWLVSVAGEYQMSNQTLHLTVNYIDRFISKMLVATQKFQLLGAVAMLVASKMEEIYPPDTKEWVYLSGDSYTVTQITKMEQLLLKVLKFDLQPPTVLTFIHHMCTEHKLDEKTLSLAMYISELVMLDGPDYFQYLPSKLAAASVALSRQLLSKQQPWPKKLASSSGYTLQQLSPVLQKQQTSFKNSPHKQQKSIHKKYSSEKYHRVATLQPKNLDSLFGEE